MHGLEGNKIFAAILFGVFVVLGVVFVPRILGEVGHLTEFVMHPEDFAKHEAEGELCKEDTGRHDIIPGFCLIPDSPRPVEPMQPFLLQLASVDVALAGSITQKTCGGCHVFTEETGAAKAGPNLWGVVNAPAGSKESYSGYSSALAAYGKSWTYEELNGFIEAPAAWLPGTKMSYGGQANQERRAQYVAYLRSLSNNPAPLPDQAQLDMLQAGYDAALAQYAIDLAAWEAGE